MGMTNPATADLADTSAWTIFATEKDREMAFRLARGRYQENLLRGNVESWSGSTLKGKARDWGLQYRRSRESLLARMRGAGLKLKFQRVGRGRRMVLVVG